MLVIKNAALFDGVSDKILANQVVIIEGDTIKAVKPMNEENYANAEIVDLTGYTLVPGFIDCHAHLLLDEVPDKENQLSISTPGGGRYPNADASIAYLGALNAKKMLYSGFTTVIDGGGVGFIDVALREAIQRGYVEGPDYYICGKQLTASPAHFIDFSVEPAGPWQMRKMIRDLMWWGVDHIKIQMSAPIRMIGRNTDRSDFTREELVAAIDEAHSAGLQVHAHVRGSDAGVDFLAAGGDIVVHGTGITDESIEMMVRNGTYLFPTLASPTPNPPQRLFDAKNSRVIDLLAATAEKHWDSARRAYKAGVKMALSTDAGGLGIQSGDSAQEMLRMKEIGMSAFEVLKAATSEAAKAVRLGDKFGKILPGYKANLVVLQDNPFDKLETVLDAKMVIKSGKIIKDVL
ncbi:MAG: Xaa-Pro dipeptidase [Firmicutes bacterium]|nr:Xaa-Pro dipeptidase [Bacillota bacterium]